MDIIPRTLGLFPTPSPTAADCNSHDTSVSPADTRYRSAVKTVVTDQREAGFEQVVTGQLHWNTGLLHPLLTADGVATDTPPQQRQGTEDLVRPKITNPIESNDCLATELTPVRDLADAFDVVIPGPFTLAHSVEDRYYHDPATHLTALAEFLAAELQSATPIDTVLIHEPALAKAPPDEDRLTRLPTVLDIITTATTATTMLVPYGAAMTEKVHAYILDATLDILGYDFIANHETNLELIAEYGTTESIACCLLDPTKISATDSDHLTARINWVAETIPDIIAPDRMMLLPNQGLTPVPSHHLGTVFDLLGNAATKDNHA